MKVVTPRMSELAVIVLRYLTSNGKTQYDDGERVTPTYDEAVSAARELKALVSE